MLALHCMMITLDEIIEHQHRFRQEIADRECVVAALEVLRTHLAHGCGPRALELGSLVSAILPALLADALPERAALLAPTLPALPRRRRSSVTSTRIWRKRDPSRELRASPCAGPPGG